MDLLIFVHPLFRLREGPAPENYKEYLSNLDTLFSRFKHRLLCDLPLGGIPAENCASVDYDIRGLLKRLSSLKRIDTPPRMLARRALARELGNAEVIYLCGGELPKVKGENAYSPSNCIFSTIYFINRLKAKPAKIVLVQEAIWPLHDIMLEKAESLLRVFLAEEKCPLRHELSVKPLGDCP